jgi:hypothetical protein
MIKADYVVGLVDGEGSFCVQVATKQSSPKRRARVELRFFLKLIERDLVVLEDLKEFFQCGSIYFQQDRRPNHQNCYRFEVFNRTELREIIIPFFETHPLRTVSKQKDFKIFKDIFSKIQEGQHLTETGLAGIRALQIQMH